MIKSEIYSSFDCKWIDKMVTLYYDTYKIVDVKFSTTIDTTSSLVIYSVMIIYKEK